MKHLARLAVVLAIAALTLGIGVRPTDAHDSYRRTSSGCLIERHDNGVGALNYVEASTCEKNNYWRGRVRDSHRTSDGLCVLARMDGIIMATSCDSAGSTFTFLDPQRNYSAQTEVCTSDYDVCVFASNRNF